LRARFEEATDPMPSERDPYRSPGAAPVPAPASSLDEEPRVVVDLLASTRLDGPVSEPPRAVRAGRPSAIISRRR
jgi:hypothetical protein